MPIIGKDEQKVKAFGDVSKRLNLSNRVYRGMQAIPVDKIVGSVGRAGDLLPVFV